MSTSADKDWQSPRTSRGRAGGDLQAPRRVADMMHTLMTRQILALGGLLLLFWILIPARLPEPRSAPSLGDCLALAGGPRRAEAGAIAALERCSALLPENVELLGDLGQAYEAAGRSADAERAYRKALDRDPDYADLRLRLGTLCLKGGSAGEAARQATLALGVEPNRQALLDLRAAAEAALAGAPK